MIQAIFFDLDGTLLDTVPDICFVLNGTLAEFGLPPITKEQTRAFVGNGAEKLVERATPEGSPRGKILASFRAKYAESDNSHTRIYAGVRECLAELKARGVKLAVITNKPQEATDRVLDKFFPVGTFDFIGGDSGSFPVKPDPTLARYAALSLRVSPGECLFVGDGETDVLTAKNAGMRSVSVLWGYRSREQLETVGAREFITSFSELEKIAENFV